MFKLIKVDGTVMNVPEAAYFKAKAGTSIACGQALVMDENGDLVACGATVKPVFIAITAITEAETNRVVAVYRVTSAQEFEVATSVSPAAFKVGNKLAIGADALTVGAVNTSAFATVVNTNGAAVAGDKIIVRF